MAMTTTAVNVICPVAAERGCIYCMSCLCGGRQGFASGDLEKDATAVRMFTDAGVELILSQVCMQSLHATRHSVFMAASPY